MKKILITALAALFMFSGCSQEGEEPLEEGVMTPEEFFEEIEVSDPAGLIDGWWYLNSGMRFEMDDHGNYKQEDDLLNSGIVEYYFRLDDGLITDVKRFKYIHDEFGWEDVAIADPAGIEINKSGREFSFKVLDTQYHCTISNEAIVQCKNDGILTIDLGSVWKDKKGKIHHPGNWFMHIGDELPNQWWGPDNE